LTEVVATKLANAQFPDARADLPAAIGHRSLIQHVLDRKRITMGGLWVGGRVTLTKTDIAFVPNGLNAELHSGETTFRMALQDLISIEVSRAVATSIIELQTATDVARLRCHGAKEFAEQIREQQRRYPPTRRRDAPG
jgi:hypothetical protein